MMMTVSVLTLIAVSASQPLSFPRPDQIKHFLVSAFVQSTVFSAARAGGVDRPSAQLIGGVTTMAVGFMKELHDHRARRSFSAGDLAWDAAGALTAAAMLNGTR